MASELVNKLKETLQPESHTAFQGENQTNEGISNEAYQSNPTETFESNRTSNLESRNFEQPREENLEARQGEPERPKKQQVKSLLGDVQNILPHSPPKQTEPALAQQSSFDPRDASRVPPSVFAQYAGEPLTPHNIPSDRARRHSTASHQEAHYNLGSDLK